MFRYISFFILIIVCNKSFSAHELHHVQSFFREAWDIELDLNPENIQHDPLLEYNGYFDPKTNKVAINANLPKPEIKLNLVHEGIHFLRHKYNANEEIWLEEGIAKVAEFIYSGVWPVKYENILLTDNNFCLLTSRSAFVPNGVGYATSFQFVQYLYSRFGGIPFLKLMLTSKDFGWNNILNSIEVARAQGIHNLPTQYTNRRSIIRHFAVALAVNDPYIASYGLFSISPYHKLKLINAVSTKTCPYASDFQITFGDLKQNTAVNEAWLIYQNPFAIKSVNEPLTGIAPDLKISIIYN